VHQITNCLEELLPKLGFLVKKLNTETLPDQNFGETFESLADQCALGIVVFDGFRPNVIFEYGYLRGKGKVVLPIKHKSASIAVRSLYALGDSVDEREIKNRTGLTLSQFSNLKEPLLGCFRELSDRHGTNIIDVDCDAELSSKEHPKTKVEAEIKKLTPIILEQYTKKSLTPVNKTNQESFERLEKLTLKLLQYFTEIVPFESANIRDAITEISNLEQQSGINVPSTVYITASSLCQTIAHKALFSEKENIASEYCGEAIKMLTRALKIEKDPPIRASIQNALGNAYTNFDFINPEKNTAKAIEAYQKALTIYTKENYPNDYAMTQNNLGFAYGTLSDFRDTEENTTKAIEAYQKALTIYTKENYPNDYAMIQNNLGNAYAYLSDVIDREGNAKKAIEAYQEALTIYTKENYPNDYATIQKALKKIRKV
jgi:tetratricopeptide (TPR) repeat protein/nucleoside 2-deoxyribosyltransferase